MMELEPGVEMEEDGNTDNNRKLFDAIECNSIEDTRYCINTLKADINSRDHQNNTPLHNAVEKGFGAIVRFLVENGADLQVENSSKCTAIDIGRNKEFYEIVNLLSAVETTSWSPGSDPALLLLPRDDEYSESKAKESLIYERSQIAVLLEEAGLKHLFVHFENHNINYLRFLRMDDDCLSQIGISELEDRRKILDIIKSLADRKWQKDSVLPNFMQKDLSSSEIVCILNNLQHHTQILSSSVNHVKSQIVRDPDMLRRNMELSTMSNLSSAIEDASDVTKTLMKSIDRLASAVGGIQPAKSSGSVLSVRKRARFWLIGALSCGIIAVAWRIVKNVRN